MLAPCCGKCRAFYFQNDVVIAKTSMTTIQLQPKQVINMMTKLQDASIIFKQTDCLHNAAISDVKDFLNITTISYVITLLINYTVIIFNDIYR
ncbi:formate dehydrogenase [Staphylococcus epidermidis]|nr:formate dehydrogenase [Staphylococcus epidermidis]EFE57897.1 formate dehydrogenase accessory domain protein [Staphylococcus epidermidis M23864:W2(grey)]AVG10159.1 formate dehydrogenase [Staphylococcus epidermidis]AXE40908.1 formate dehydrogenase [Staphylococcus epidermidis]KAB2219478.1 formate dehydrogenase [Staphylococcus epidermidis]